jgi:RNA polymerase sigma-70 factor, ECF subfamily
VADEANGELADEELAVRASRAGGEGAFDLLVVRWQRRVFQLVGRFARDVAEQEDLAQEVFLRAFRGLAGYRRSAPFEHWLMRIATRVSLDALRARRRRPEAPLPGAEELGGEAALDRALAAPAERQAERDAARMAARDLLDRLAPKDRLVLVLLDLEGWTTAEISARLGTSRPAIKMRASRARRALGRWLEGEGR